MHASKRPITIVLQTDDRSHPTKRSRSSIPKPFLAELQHQLV
ncbi:hypothetical protein [Coleofasciculus sp. FACHB-SPT36]|nr:hypothetical protein [Coleofasciculus sp. FACHB-SPT36]